MTTQERTETCETCRFWNGKDRGGGTGFAQCRRHAPHNGFWWNTQALDWCGEWQGEKGESE